MENPLLFLTKIKSPTLSKQAWNFLDGNCSEKVRWLRRPFSDEGTAVHNSLALCISCPNTDKWTNNPGQWASVQIWGKKWFLSHISHQMIAEHWEINLPQKAHVESFSITACIHALDRNGLFLSWGCLDFGLNPNITWQHDKMLSTTLWYIRGLSSLTSFKQQEIISSPATGKVLKPLLYARSPGEPCFAVPTDFKCLDLHFFQFQVCSPMQLSSINTTNGAHTA